MRTLTKVIPVLLFLLLTIFLYHCDEESPTNSDIQPGNGLIFVDSNPPGAEIFLQNTSTGKFTPDSIKNLVPESYDVRLKLNEFTDSSLVVNVKGGLTITVYVDFTLSTGNLFVSSSPQGAQIFLENINTEKTTPDSIFYLEPRSYNVKLIFTNGDDVTQNVLIEAGKTSDLILNYFGTLSIDSNPPGAEVLLDSITTGKVTPAILDSLFPGQYEVSLKLTGYSDISVTVQIHPGNQELFINYPPITTTTTTVPTTTTTVPTTTTTVPTTTTTVPTTTTTVPTTTTTTVPTTSTTTYSITATISGVGTLPPGEPGSVQNTRVALYTSVQNWNFDITFAFTACDGSGNYTLSGIPPGVYYMDAWKDNDNNQVWGSSGDYIWWNGSGVFPNITLAPIQFPAGTTTVNFELFVVP